MASLVGLHSIAFAVFGEEMQALFSYDDAGFYWHVNGMGLSRYLIIGIYFA